MPQELKAWRAVVTSCAVLAGDDDDFDLGALRRQVRTENAPLSESAAHVDAIIREWERTKDDKTFAMKTRFVRARTAYTNPNHSIA